MWPARGPVAYDKRRAREGSQARTRAGQYFARPLTAAARAAWLPCVLTECGAALINAGEPDAPSRSACCNGCHGAGPQLFRHRCLRWRPRRGVPGSKLASPVSLDVALGLVAIHRHRPKQRLVGDEPWRRLGAHAPAVSPCVSLRDDNTKPTGAGQVAAYCSTARQTERCLALFLRLRRGKKSAVDRWPP
jgi:hypothetical protein